jgi:protein-tyrosine phosphatase
MNHDLAAPQWVDADEVPSWRGSEILPGLFMGGTADRDVVHVAAHPRYNVAKPRAYDAVVTLYAWAQPVSWEVEELRYGFGDGDVHGVDLDRLIQAAVWAWQRWRGGDRVLIRCQAGLNRSGLVTALVLMLEGYDAIDAVRLIRTQRSPWALCTTPSNL